MTLVEAEVAEALGVEALLLRRNVITRGVRLARLVGETFRVGTAEAEGVRLCEPCGYLESLVRPRLKDELAGRGGLRARILGAGVVRPGDAIVSPSAGRAREEGR